MTILDYLNRMQDIINTHIQVIILSPVLAKEILKANIEDFPPNVLFHLVNYISEKEALVLKGDLKAMFLKMHMAGDIQLYTLQDLKDKLCS